MCLVAVVKRGVERIKKMYETNLESCVKFFKRKSKKESLPEFFVTTSLLPLLFLLPMSRGVQWSILQRE